MRITKTDKKDNQVFLSYDCEFSMVEDGYTMEVVPTFGDTYLLSVCMMDAVEEEQRCGEYWILMPPDASTTILDKTDPRHQVLLLVDKNEYEKKNELVLYVPTSHVLMHDADMLGIQLLTYHRSHQFLLIDEVGPKLNILFLALSSVWLGLFHVKSCCNCSVMIPPVSTPTLRRPAGTTNPRAPSFTPRT